MNCDWHGSSGWGESQKDVRGLSWAQEGLSVE